MSGGRSSLDRGKRGEREVCKLVEELLGFVCNRGQAGHADDRGDVFGVPDTTLQVADWTDVRAAALAKPVAAERQARTAGTTFAASFVRFRGGTWRVVLTPEQWATYARESLPMRRNP